MLPLFNITPLITRYMFVKKKKKKKKGLEVTAVCGINGRRLSDLLKPEVLIHI